MQESSLRNAIKLSALCRYRSTEKIWRDDDPWHVHTHAAIHRFIGSASKRIMPHAACRILNVGSGGEDYGLLPENQTHVDIVDRFINTKRHYAVADAENLPFEDSSFHMVVCVGSVLNYCSALEVLAEIARVLTADGALILEFETSTSLEFIGTSDYNQDVTIVNTFYQDTPERIWLYSVKYILRLLQNGGFRVDRVKRVHVLSALLLRMRIDARFAAKWGPLDRYTSMLPWVNNHGGNVILSCHKVSSKAQ